MLLKEEIRHFIDSPFPIWDSALTVYLVDNKIGELIRTGVLQSADGYSTTHVLTGQENFIRQNRYPLVSCQGSTIYLEAPSMETSATFYWEHGLNPVMLDDVKCFTIKPKLGSALNVLSYLPECFRSVIQLVKSIQVLKQEDKDFDISYSHPDIPFTIFISICEVTSPASSLRLAESILHESMHLKLTLIEQIVPLIEEGFGETFYSPWRDEQRPLRGVLHGIFVFTAILHFYNGILPFISQGTEIDFLLWRIEQIKAELHLIKEFPNCTGLTKDGATLSTNLLTWN